MIKGKRPGLQWMRALAALMVVVDHGLYTLVDKAGAGPGLLAAANGLGRTGVELFFLISGFVMVVSSTDRFGPEASLDFLRRRLIRIVPLYWMATAVYAAKEWLVGAPITLARLAGSLLFIPMMNPKGEIQPVYGLGWTLEYEMLFYGVFAIGLLWSLRATWMLAVGGLGALVWAGTVADPGVGSPFAVALHFWSRSIVLFFLAGMALPWLAERLLSVVRIGPGPAVMLGSLLAATALAIGYSMDVPTWLQLMLLALPVTVAALGAAPMRPGRFIALAVLLGDASYSIYLTHSFLIGPLARVYAKLGLHAPAAYLLLCLVACSGIGVLCFRFVETPVTRWLSSRTRPALAIRPAP